MELNDKQQQFWKFVQKQHKGQVRKYTAEPYENHLWAVAETVSQYIDAELVILSALAHDIYEDTDTTVTDIHIIMSDIGYSVNDAVIVDELIDELTDKFTSKVYPGFNRKARKAAEALRLSSISPSAQSIKYADFIDNISSIAQHDPDFARVYIEEKIRILDKIRLGNINLLIGACGAIHQAQLLIR